MSENEATGLGHSLLPPWDWQAVRGTNPCSQPECFIYNGDDGQKEMKLSKGKWRLRGPHTGRTTSQSCGPPSRGTSGLHYPLTHVTHVQSKQANYQQMSDDLSAPRKSQRKCPDAQTLKNWNGAQTDWQKCNLTLRGMKPAYYIFMSIWLIIYAGCGLSLEAKFYKPVGVHV